MKYQVGDRVRLYNPAMDEKYPESSGEIAVVLYTLEYAQMYVVRFENEAYKSSHPSGDWGVKQRYVYDLDHNPIDPT